MASSGGGHERVELEFDVLRLEQTVNSILKIADLIDAMQKAAPGASSLAQLAAATSIVGAAIFATKKFSDVVSEVASTLTGFAKDTAALAGTGQEVALARIIGRVAGIGNVGALGAQIQQQSLEGFGLLTAKQLGLPFRPFEVGTATDRAKLVIDALEGLRKTIETQGIGAAQLQVRRLPALEPLLPLAEAATPETIAALKDLARVQAEAFSPERINAAIRFQIALVELGTAFDTLKAHLTPLVEFARFAIQGFFPGSVPDEVRRAQMGNAEGIDANTKAITDNTLTLKEFQGIFGGGRRARTALPAAFGVGGGSYLREAIQSDTLKFGAYSMAR